MHILPLDTQSFPYSEDFLMKHALIPVFAGALVCLSFMGTARAKTAGAGISLSPLPLSFVETSAIGGTSAGYLSRIPGCALHFSSDGMRMVLGRKATDSKDAPLALAVTFPGSRRDVVPRGEDACVWKSNFFIGDDRSKWRTGVTNYNRVRYAGLYNGVDLVYYGVNGALKYDFVVRRGSDPSRIRIAYDTGKPGSIALNGRGELVVKSPAGKLVEKKPYAYQVIGGVEVARNTSYEIVDAKNGVVAFDVGYYDPSHDLVIDPAITYSTYLGGGADDESNSIALDAAGCVYITGQAQAGFPTTGGAYDTVLNGPDVFVAKLNAAGTALLYSTYIGGISSDYGTAIAVDAAGCAYVTGSTFPDGGGLFPTVNQRQSFSGGFWYWGFFSKLSADGASLLYSTYIGGTNSHTYPQGIALDAAGMAYVAGSTAATQINQFPLVGGSYDTTHNGGYDVFVCKFDATLAGAASLLYSTYIGNTGSDQAMDVAVDTAGCAHVTGWTNSGGGASYPTTGGAFDTSSNGNYDVFVTKLNAGGTALVFSTFLGGASTEMAYAIAVDAVEGVVVGGYTESVAFPTTGGAYDTALNVDGHDGFISCISLDGTTLRRSTFLGGTSAIEYVRDIAIDSGSRIHVTGYTSSADFPVTGDAIQSASGGGKDVFYSVFKKTLGATDLDFSTYLGGTGDDEGHGIAIDAASGTLAYITGFANDSFPTTAGAFDTTHNTGTDVFAAKINLAGGGGPPPVPALDTIGFAVLFTLLALYSVFRLRRTAGAHRGF